MRRVIVLAVAAVIASTTGCAKHYARRYAAAEYAAAPCGCDGAVGPIDGVVMPGPAVVSPQAGTVVTGPMGRTVLSTPSKSLDAAY